MGETHIFQQAVKRAFLKSEPDVGVKLPGFFKSVLVEIEDKKLAAGAEYACSLVDRALRVLGVVQRLTEDREVDGTVREGDVFDVTVFIGEIGEAIFSGEFGADLDHLNGIIDAPDLSGAVGEELRDEAFAGTQIGDVDGGSEAQREVPDGFPRTAGAVVFAETAGDEVEILLLCTPALLEYAVEVAAVIGHDGQVGDRGRGGR